MLIFFVIMALLSFVPTLWVKAVIKRYHTEIADLPGTGGELALHFVQRFELQGVTVEVSQLGDHYAPATKVIGLSEATWSNKSLSAIAIAAHEVGHAIQDQRNDPRMRYQNTLHRIDFQLSRLIRIALVVLPFAGILSRSPVITLLCLGLILTGMITQLAISLLNLPLELDASFGKALPILKEGQYITPAEYPAVQKILRAAALTYVAGAAGRIFNIWQWIKMFRR